MLHAYRTHNRHGPLLGIWAPYWYRSSRSVRVLPANNSRDLLPLAWK